MNPKDLFSDILPEDRILIGDACRSYELDRTNTQRVTASCVLLPQSTKEVSAIMARCYSSQISVLPSGGRTGLSGALIPLNNEILVSLEKMNNFIEIDPVGATLMVEAGCILEHVQEAAESAGMYFPLDFAAKGSCMIGGCLATNAGGVKVIKYGMTRQFVLGLEVVLNDGRIIDLNKALVKDNSGYDLKQLFIGAEGTLGIITKATFQCESIPKHKRVTLFAVESFESIPSLFQQMKQSGLDCLAFEFITEIGMNAVLNAMPQIKRPFQEKSDYYVLLEVDEANDDKLFSFIETVSEKDLILDAVIAENSSMVHDFWMIREAVSDSLYLLGPLHANDVSVPISSLYDFVVDLDQLIEQKYKQFTLGLFGHIGDGNFHIYIIDEHQLDASVFNQKIKELDSEMFPLVQKYSGSVSAEHGIGHYKKDALQYQKSELELKYSKRIKELFDPTNILNPGKVV